MSTVPACRRLRARIAACCAAVAGLLASGAAHAQSPAAKPDPEPRQLVAVPFSATGPVGLADVMRAVTNQYPPLLAALIERDIAAGRLRSAQGAFDLQTFAKAFGNPTGYYESGTLDAGFEQFLGVWGSSVFGGYRIERGTLPDYDKNRTQAGGEPRVGLRVPLLRDGSIDRRRAGILQARLDRELADPFIRRQQLDFIRASASAYWAWVGSGRRLAVAEELLRVATDRGVALTNQVRSGLVRPIVLTDNHRLVVSRQLGLVQARRRFEANSIALSLFLRDDAGHPVLAGRDRLPPAFPDAVAPDGTAVVRDIEVATGKRPEIRRIRLQLDRAEVDRRLAENNLLPNLDVGVTASQDLGARRYKDKSELEVEAGVELKFPLQRREAKGRLEAAEAAVRRLNADEGFARDRIAAEIRDAYSAWSAAHEQTLQTRLNADLARTLEEAEQALFERGSADLLAVQIRELATFEARSLDIDALAEYFRARADYEVAAMRW